MKKTLFFLVCLSVMLLTGCSTEPDNNVLNPIDNSSAESVRWYGVKLPDEPSTRGLVDEGKLWNQRVGIYIKFINNPANPAMLDRIKTIATEWEQYAGIKFHFVNNTQKTDVRIAFDWNRNKMLTWSYTGTDAKFVRDQNMPTAVFGGLQYQNEKQFRGDVLRVFGQILGLEYEQRHQSWTFWRNEIQLRRYWETMFVGMKMNWAEIKEYVFTPLTGANAVYPTQTDNIDEQSIMAWPYYTNMQALKLLANYELSAGDKAFIGYLYPKEDKESLSTIQKAWVDAGYFRWVDNTKSALKITELGLQQESFPDVSDGEQLTSALTMFSLYPDRSKPGSKLKKAPRFNTSNIRNFAGIFYECQFLTEVPLYDTSKGENFNKMFYDCRSLTEVPLFDTSKGRAFRNMFENCRSLITIPAFNTSNGTAFSFMFEDCGSLVEVPFFDISKGTEFQWMFSGCHSLITIPPFNTSNGIEFSAMFRSCYSLIKVPPLNTSNGTTLLEMFSGCRSLVEKPMLDLSKATSWWHLFFDTPFDDGI